MSKTTLIVGLLLIAGAFWGGMKYGQSQTPAAATLAGRGNFPGSVAGTNGRNFAGGRGAGVGGATSGQILARDDKSFTVKLRDGGSRIVFYASSTQISKATAGTVADLTVGQEVTVFGSTNSDGSVTAQLVQVGAGLRPRLATSTPAIN